MHISLRFLIIVAGLLLALSASSDAAPIKINGLYVNTFGNPNDQALIYIHGGPGYNSYGFEISAAEQLAAKGFYVVVYDQRGASRSAPVANVLDFNYRSVTRDLKSIVDKLKIKEPILLGHSFGGSIALKFLDRYPDVARGAILIAAPISFPQTFWAVINRATSLNLRPTIFPDEYQKQMANLAQIQNVATAFMCPVPIFGVHLNGGRCIPPAIIATAFSQALALGTYNTANPSPEEKSISGELKASPQKNLLNDINPQATVGYAFTENYAAQDLFETLKKHRENVFGIYATEDGLFDQAQLTRIENTISPPNFRMVENASHALFQEQRTVFVDQVTQFARKLNGSECVWELLRQSGAQPFIH
jgi:proline iminopeptidase